MKIQIDKQTKEMRFEGDISQLLKELKIQREECVVKVNGKIAPDNKELKEMDEVEIIKVVFGG